MSIRTKLTLSLFLVVVMALSVPMVFAKSSGHGGHWGIEEKFFHKAHSALKNQEELGLSEEQVDAIHSLKRDTKKAIIRYDADIASLKVDIGSLLYATPVDVKAVHKLVDEKYDIKKSKSKSLVST